MSAHEGGRLAIALARRDRQQSARMAYIGAQLQDWATATHFYQQAIAVQDSPALPQALAQLPGH